MCELDRRRKISEKMKENFKTGKIKGWSHINSDKNRRSYPEKFFLKVFENNGLNEKFTIQEKVPYGKYHIDFLITELKIIIEIDGEQHFRDKKAIEHDKIRDDYFLGEGFRIYRIRWKDAFKNTKNEITELLNFISDNELQRKYKIEDCLLIKTKKAKKVNKNKKCNCGDLILKSSKQCRECWKKSIRNDNYKFIPERKNTCEKCGEKIYGEKMCIKCLGIKNRKIERPSKDILEKEIIEIGYSAVGRKYGVSDNTIRKWIK